MPTLEYSSTTVVQRPVRCVLMAVIHEDTSAPLIYYFGPVAFG